MKDIVATKKDAFANIILKDGFNATKLRGEKVKVLVESTNKVETGYINWSCATLDIDDPESEYLYLSNSVESHHNDENLTGYCSDCGEDL